MNLRSKTYNALFWSLIDQAGEQIIRFVFSLILARLLLPEQFGLIGIAYVVTELAREFVNSGFGMALIRKKNATIVDESSVFYFNIFIGAIATILIYTLSPFIGNFYRSNELVSVLRALSFNVIIGSFGTIHLICFTKKLNFKSQTKIGLPATIISGIIGITLAFFNFGVWALTLQSIMRTTLFTMLLWKTNNWRPKLVFSYHSLTSMFTFGSKLLIGSLLQKLFDNTYTIIIGRMYSSSLVGYFTRAKQTQQLPLSSLWTIIGRVYFPVLAVIKDDVKTFNKALEKAALNISFLVFPALVLVTVCAPNLFMILFGEKWIKSVPIFQILCIGSIFLPLEKLNLNSLLAKGNSSIVLKLNIFKQVTTLLSALLTSKYGLMPMLYSYVLISFIMFMATAYFVRHKQYYTLAKQIVQLLPYMFCTLIMTIFLLVANQITIKKEYIIILQISIGSIIYLSTAYLLKLSAFFDNVNLVLKIIRKKSPAIIVD